MRQRAAALRQLAATCGSLVVTFDGFAATCGNMRRRAAMVYRYFEYQKASWENI